MNDAAAGVGRNRAGSGLPSGGWRPRERLRGGRRPGGLRSWLAGRTLRGRLIAGLLALLALAGAFVGLVTYLALRGFLFHQLDQQLSAAKARYVGCVQNRGGPPPPPDYDESPPPKVPNCGNEIPGQAAGTFSARLVKYTVTNANIEAGRCKLSVTDKAVLTRLPVNGEPYNRDLPSARGEYRLIAVRSHDGDVLVTGLPLGNMQDTLQRVELAEVAVFSAALLLTGVIGTGWVRFSLRPLRRVTTTAAEVTGLPLGSGEVVLPHRVPDADPRTEVGQLGVAFNRMLGHVESALARRHASEARLRGFAADASHELRTPLAAIRGYAELARRHPGTLPDDVAHALSRVEAESARMSGLVDDLLLLARLDAGRPLADDPVDLTRLAIDAASDARAAAPGHRWQLDLPGEPVLVRGDEQRLRQVLANLVSNAARHTPKGTTVSIALAQRGGAPSGDVPGASGGPGGGMPGGKGGPGGSAVLSVADDGPGIPAELQPTLFERFVRGDSSRSRAAGSTGLGLAIVDAVVAAHGGHAKVTSRPGQTVFAITLPLPTAPANSDSPSAPPS
jgi:two-component system OmpR family sensor kinase